TVKTAKNEWRRSLQRCEDALSSADAGRSITGAECVQRVLTLWQDGTTEITTTELVILFGTVLPALAGQVGDSREVIYNRVTKRGNVTVGSKEVRRTTVATQTSWALKMIQDSIGAKAVAALEHGLRHREPLVRYRCLEHLMRISPQNTIKYL